MRITDREPGTSVWNKQQGWTCEPFPLLGESEIALTVHVKSGMPQYQLEQKLESVGILANYYHLGHNKPTQAKASSLLYLIKICSNYSELSEGLQKLESAEIPLNAISVITSKLQQSILA